MRNTECGVRNQTSSQLVRLGCLPYLNVKPLVYRFEHGNLPEDWDLVYATPSMLARMLADGRIDAAPVSSFACIANPDLAIVPGICIASKGEVTTVLMLSRVETRDVKSVAADTSSLSGRALLRIVLSENYGIEPEFVDCEPDAVRMLQDHDAALIIGNPAMLCDKTGLNVLDLGEEWLKLTSLPAVFAVWAGPENSLTQGLISNLQDAKEEGLRLIPQIAREQAAELGISAEICEDYLAQIMKYDLGAREIESLSLFAKKAREHGLIDIEPEVNILL